MSKERMRKPYTEGDLRNILKRAIQIESEDGEVLAELDVFEIARELQISQMAVARALHELDQSQSQATAPTGMPSRSAEGGLPPMHAMPFFTGAVGALTPIVLTGLVPLAQGRILFGSSIGTMFCLQAAIISMAIRYEGEAPHQRWQLANLTLWAGLATGFGFTNQYAVPEFWPVFVGFAGLTALGGSVVISLKTALKFQEADINDGAGPGQRRSRQIGSRLKKWVLRHVDATHMSRISTGWIVPTSKPNCI